ncbi:GNAT family acetyltransferase [Marispirochaeta aestuarii]|uniref:GNAT family acetyltransferase n=1 Tax=Marispirochaeta aestuarii TaxID=1963862 RepID=UPI0029C8C9C4|nr:GNAT family acetyltransferase [Marispirochaeta aestuarii]
MVIEKYDNSKHRNHVIELWNSVFGYSDKRNDPSLAIDKKLEVDDQLYIALVDGKIIGTIMTGYDGHRGWIYSLAVQPEYRKSGIGSKLLKYAEEVLTEKGCMKINLQILSTNTAVKDFYRKNGYEVEERISMGKQIHKNVPGDK